MVAAAIRQAFLQSDAEAARQTWRHVAREPQKFADLYGSFSVKWFFGLCRFLVWRCVQVRLACSAGDSPVGVEVRAP
jgi:hypothetical protein